MENANIVTSIIVARNIAQRICSDRFDPQGISLQADFISQQMTEEYNEKGWGRTGNLMHDTMNKLYRLSNCHILLEDPNERVLLQLRKDSQELIEVLESYGKKLAA